MKILVEKTIDNKTLVQLIDELKSAEVSRNMDASVLLFKDLWSDIETEPDFSNFENIYQAKLYRLAGYFLSLYGKAKNLSYYQERAKNNLTKAVSLFASLGDSDAEAEANVMLALCYLYAGSIDECEALLDQTALDFSGNHLNPVFLQIRINRIITSLWKKEYHKAHEIVAELQVPMEFCTDKRLCGMYHTQSGLMCKGIGDYQKSIYHYNEAIRYAKEYDNQFFICANHNNLASFYTKIGDYENAHKNSDCAIEIAHKLSLTGWLPHMLDTKAMVYSQQGCHELALEYIDKAISDLEKGEDIAALTDILWNKCRVLLRSEKKEEAILSFNELIGISKEKMGEYAVTNYTREFSKLIYVKNDGSLDSEIRRFKRNEVINAIRTAKYSLGQAASILEISFDELVKILDDEFPELYQEMDIYHPSSIPMRFSSSKELRESAPRQISHLNLPGSSIHIVSQKPQSVLTFYVSMEKMSEVFGYGSDAVLAVKRTSNLIENDFVLVNSADRSCFMLGRVKFDRDLNLFYFQDTKSQPPVILDELEVIGNPIGYARFDEIDADQLSFEPLNF